MKKEIIKNILIIVLCLIIGFVIIYKKKNKFVYIEDEKRSKCYRCVIIDNQYFCEVSIEKESDK